MKCMSLIFYFFTSLHTKQSVPATTEVAPTLEGSFAACKKRKTTSQPLSPTRKSTRLQEKVSCVQMEDDEIPQDEEEIESSPVTESEADNTQPQFEAAAESEVSAIDIQPTGELYAWAVPSEEELDACARA